MIRVNDVLDELSPFHNFEENTDKQRRLHRQCSEWFARHIAELVRTSAAKDNPILRRVGGASPSVIRRCLSSLLAAVSGASDTSLDAILHIWSRELQHTSELPSSVTYPTADASGLEQQDPLLVQAAFLFLGWFSMTYEPSLVPAELKLEIILPRSAETSPRFRKQRQVPTDSLDISSASSMSFPHLFASFGQRLPGLHNSSEAGPGPATQGQTDVLMASNIYYSNLYRVGKLRIQWVNDVVHHLDLDERNRTVSLFAFPTFCSLVCLSDPTSTQPLSR